MQVWWRVVYVRCFRILVNGGPGACDAGTFFVIEPWNASAYSRGIVFLNVTFEQFSVGSWVNETNDLCCFLQRFILRLVLFDGEGGGSTRTPEYCLDSC